MLRAISCAGASHVTSLASCWVLTCTVRTCTTGVVAGQARVALRSLPSGWVAPLAATCSENGGVSARLKIGSVVTAPQLSGLASGNRATLPAAP
ncbi:hypothetical protein D3C81_2080230 [compost metagenome]